MRGVPAAILSVWVLAGFAGAASACDVRDAYVARLGPYDHFNSSGERLKTAAAIIRQDRANFHALGRPDYEDESDTFFTSKENRALMEELLARSAAPGSLLDRIVDSTPMVHVRVCRGPRGDYLIVDVM